MKISDGSGHGKHEAAIVYGMTLGMIGPLLVGPENVLTLYEAGITAASDLFPGINDMAQYAGEVVDAARVSVVDSLKDNYSLGQDLLNRQVVAMPAQFTAIFATPAIVFGLEKIVEGINSLRNMGNINYSR